MQFDQLRRRDFIALIGGWAAWPLAARAQQGERMRRIGIIQPASSDDAEYQIRVGALRTWSASAPAGRRVSRP
jgi:hypothetical protein